MFELSLRVRVALAFLAIYTIWGSTYLGIRIAIQSIPPFLMAGIRFIIAGGILLIWAAVKGIPHPTFSNWKAATVVGGLLLLGGNGGVTWAEQFIPSSLAAVLITIVPIWIVLIEFFRKPHKGPSRQVALGLGMGFIGVVLLIGPISLARADSFYAVGTILLVFTSLSWALGSIYSRTAPLPKSRLVGTGMEMFTGGVLLTLVALVSGEYARFHPGTVSTASLVALIYLIIFGSLIAFTSYIWLLTKTTATRASTYAYVNPVVAIFLGVALAGEQLAPQTLASSAVIVVAVFIITTFKETKDRHE